MTISSWDAAYYLGALLDISVGEVTKTARDLMPEYSNNDLCDFVEKSVDGLDKKSLLTGAMLASIIMEKVNFIPCGDDEVVNCVICGNQKPVPATADDEFGWICSDCDLIYKRIRMMDRMKAVRIDEDELKSKYGHMNQGGTKDEST